MQLLACNIYRFSGRYFFAIDAYGIMLDTLLAPLIVMCYFILLLLIRKEAIKWWIIALMILPFLYTLAILGDMQSFHENYIQLLNVNHPILYIIQ